MFIKCLPSWVAHSLSRVLAFCIPTQAYQLELIQFRFELMPSTPTWYRVCWCRPLIWWSPIKRNNILLDTASEGAKGHLHYVLSTYHMPSEQSAYSMHGYSSVCYPVLLKPHCVYRSGRVVGYEILQSFSHNALFCLQLLWWCKSLRLASAQ